MGLGSGVKTALAGVALALAIEPASADTLRWALTQAYINNPQINAARAQVRGQDELVPQALSGYRPRISLSASAGEAYVETLSKVATFQGNVSSRTAGNNGIQSYGATVQQTLLNGFGTANRTRQAEQQVSSSREALRNVEQTILLAAVQAYMNLIRDAATLNLQRSNVEVLQEQLRQTRDRYDVGEVTRTDVAQAESRLAVARATLLTAESNYTTSRSTYRQVIGVEAGRLDPASPVDRLSPSNLQQAIRAARSQHPQVTAQMFSVDAAQFQVKIAESSLYPTLTAVGQVTKSYGSTTQLSTLETLQASAVAQFNVPIYQGGSEYSLIRQAKETLQQQRVNLDNQRDVQQQNLVQTWGLLEASKASVLANQTAVNAAEIALNGVREEARVGQRTTLDVLNAQQELVNARVNLVNAQRDRVVNSYGVLAGVGMLSPTVLQLDVPIYDPVVHYHQVRDTWAGVRTPDGK